MENKLPTSVGPLMTVAEAANTLNISRSHAYNLMDRGDLAYVKLGKSRRIPEAAVNQLITRNLVPAR